MIASADKNYGWCNQSTRHSSLKRRLSNNSIIKRYTNSKSLNDPWTLSEYYLEDKKFRKFDKNDVFLRNIKYFSGNTMNLNSGAVHALSLQWREGPFRDVAHVVDNTHRKLNNDKHAAKQESLSIFRGFLPVGYVRLLKLNKVLAEKVMNFRCDHDIDGILKATRLLFRPFSFFMMVECELALPGPVPPALDTLPPDIVRIIVRQVGDSGDSVRNLRLVSVVLLLLYLFSLNWHSVVELCIFRSRTAGMQSHRSTYNSDCQSILFELLATVRGAMLRWS